jgi:HPt (histidine-containing phosphotransfer) domain-containing protein
VAAATAGAARARAAGGAPPRPEPVRPAGSVVDRSALDQLYDELADPALVATVVRTFLRELPARVENIDAACAAADTTRLQLVTHTLRSTSLAVGAVGLADACVALEGAIADGGGPAAWDTGRLHDMAARVEAELGAALGDAPGGRQASMR